MVTAVAVHAAPLLLLVSGVQVIVTGMTSDWLVTPPSTPAAAHMSADGCALTLANGLLSRTFAVPAKGCPAPNWVTTDLADITDDEVPPKSALAALDVEASVELVVGGISQRWDVGGLNQSCSRWLRSQPHSTHEEIFSTCAFLNRSQQSYSNPKGNASAFQYINHTIGPTVAPFDYKHARHAADTPWPPAGLHLAVRFGAPATSPAVLRAVAITVHYELYQGVPAHSKWVTVSAPSNDSDAASVVVANVFVEQLRVNDDYAGSSYPIADAWVTGAGTAENACKDLVPRDCCTMRVLSTAISLKDILLLILLVLLILLPLSRRRVDNALRAVCYATTIALAPYRHVSWYWMHVGISLGVNLRAQCVCTV